MDLFLQIWGGCCYLLNKILFALAEGKTTKIKKQLKISGWTVYILGVPAWIIILAANQNWIAASIEFGGLPAMLLGLYNTYHDNQKPNKLFNKSVTLATYSAIVIGISYSMTIHHGITSISQVLELGVTVGFLLGSYLLAKFNPKGWFFFMLMNLSMASLMLLQQKYVLAVLQTVSLSFVIYGFYKSTRNTAAK